MNSFSFFTAGRRTHIKIVVVALIASLTVIVVGIAARPPADRNGMQATVYKPHKPTMATSEAGKEAR